MKLSPTISHTYVVSGAAGLILSLAFLFLPSPQPALAAEQSLLIKKDEYSLTANSQTINNWQGVFKRRRSLILTFPKQPLDALIAYYYLGQKPTAYQTRIQTYRYDPEAIYRWVKTNSASIETEATEPALTIKNGRAVSFTPPTLGVSVDTYTTTFNIIAALEGGYDKTELAVNTTQPRTTLASLNDVGIKELIARGESTFEGSPKNRRINIAVGIEKIKGVIIYPGEEFSFNKWLGPVEKEYGFVPELVIKRTGTVPELGGGLCQVSSTTFRAAMKAGLPIVQRKNHSYAVQYYAPQGTDATIYPGVIDLKFTNDTPGAILIWPHLKDKDTLYFDFYGTKDDRKVTLEKPIQYDRKSDGSMKATWTRHVTKNGDTETISFNSVYLPPALFHKEEVFVGTAAPGTAPATPEQTNSPTTIQPQLPEGQTDILGPENQNTQSNTEPDTE